jgi:hypothetical protein
MSRAFAFVLTFGLLAAGCGGSEPAPEPAAAPSADADAGWITLFDGSNLDGWTPIGDANWRLADGAVEADSGTGFLVSNQSYGDFELRLEFWVNPEANSGVFIRCSDPGEVTAENSYEVNIFDQRPDPMYRTGGIVDIAPPTATIDAGGQWNTYEIAAHGSHLSVTLNGTQTVDVMDGKFARGPFALQYAAGTVRFRNVQIRPVDGAAAMGAE